MVLWAIHSLILSSYSVHPTGSVRLEPKNDFKNTNNLEQYRVNEQNLAMFNRANDIFTRNLNRAEEVQKEEDRMRKMRVKQQQEFLKVNQEF